MGRGQPGALPQTEKREQFARLISAGVPVCRRVGVHRKTGIRWRHGRTITTSSGERRHHPSVITPAGKEISPRFLSEDERVHIADLVRQGIGVRRIAKELRRSSSTISRELRRNREEPNGPSPRIGERWSVGPGPGAASCCAIHCCGRSCRTG